MELTLGLTMDGNSEGAVLAAQPLYGGPGSDLRVVGKYAAASDATFVRTGSVVRSDGALLPADFPAITGRINLLEGAATSYYSQTYSLVAGKVSTDAPTTQTVSLPATGSYVVWCSGNAALSVTVAADTAAGSGWGTLTNGTGYLVLTITTLGNITVTIANGAAGDKVQVTTGIFPTSYIPTPTSTPVTRASSGSDTSGNGLQLPLNQAMIDSLVG